MMRLMIILLFLFFFSSCASSTNKYYEKYYQTLLCNELAGEMEYVLSDRTRIDCLTDEYAIEVDFAKKWAEGIGQSLYYAHMTGKKPAVGLIVDMKKEERFLKRLDVIAKKYNIRVFIIEKIK